MDFFIENISKTLRLDTYLNEKFPNKSRSYFQKLIANEKLLINNSVTKASLKVRGGELIHIEEFELCETNYQPENLPLKILYEDSDIIVLDKIRGMMVHPDETVKSGTLVNALLYHCKDLSGINGVKRPGIVHRLDKNTSGVMVVAKTDEAHLSLADQIRNKIAVRKYLAIVHGVLKDDSGIINGAIGRSKTNRKKMAITSDGKIAITKFKVLKRFREFTYVGCQLMTGRTHQIRVHMSAIGHPLIGDDKYTTRKNIFRIQGQALHSHSLELIHPRTLEKIKFTAALPEDMKNILDALS